jgi:hypothetical protein
VVGPMAGSNDVQTRPARVSGWEAEGGLIAFFGV